MYTSCCTSKCLSHISLRFKRPSLVPFPTCFGCCERYFLYRINTTILQHCKKALRYRRYQYSSPILGIEPPVVATAISNRTIHTLFRYIVKYSTPHLIIDISKYRDTMKYRYRTFTSVAILPYIEHRTGTNVHVCK